MANTINININKADIGLDLVDNTSDLNKPISTATQTALDLKDNIAITQDASTDVKFRLKTIFINGTTPLTGNITFNTTGGARRPGMVQLMLHNDSVEPTFSAEFVKTKDSFDYVPNVVNYITFKCVDQNKATYTITQEGTSFVSGFLATTLKGAVNGLAELDGTGKVPSAQLPSYVDDVVEVANFSALPVTGESGKIYVTLDNNLTYRWSGSAYVEISQSLALGELSTTAYRGDRGATAYNHSQLITGNPHNVTKSDVGLSNVANSDTTTTANITDSSNKRFVTDAQLTSIDNAAAKNVVLDRKTASYTLVASDNNKLIEMNVATANNVTIDNSIFSAGNQILVSQYGAGQVTFVAGSGVTLRSPSGKLKLTGQYSAATIIAISASEFYIFGDLTA